MPQYVILRHDSPRGVHFDFMLEVGDVLKTWALPQPPQPGVEIECEALGDHRRAYLDYEGPLSGNRGSVTRWDRGEYNVERQSDEKWVVNLASEKLVGRATLHCQANNPNGWAFLFRDDAS